MTHDQRPWTLPIRLDDIPDEGRRIHAVADPASRQRIAALAGLRGVERLEADLDVRRHRGHGMRITGTVSATVGQDCVVTLEPVDNEVEETIDLTLLPAESGGAENPALAEENEEEAPELLVNGAADLGAIATEFFLLGIDPYPRKPGAVFTPPRQDADTAGPFAALAKLKQAKETK